MIDQEDLYKAKRVNLLEFLEDAEMDGVCPFCKNTSFHANRTWYLCKNCDAGGDQIAYMMIRYLLHFKEAIGKLIGKEI